MTSPPSGDDRATLEADLGLHREEVLAQNEELRRANAELTGARARLAVIFDAAPIGYAALDDHGRIVQANRALATLLGVEPDALVGRAFDRACAPPTARDCAATSKRWRTTAPRAASSSPWPATAGRWSASWARLCPRRPTISSASSWR